MITDKNYKDRLSLLQICLYFHEHCSPSIRLLLITTSFWTRGVPIVNIHLESNNVCISNHFPVLIVLNDSELFNKFKQTKNQPT